MWQTKEDTDSTIVNYGTSADSLDSSETGSSSTYLETYDHVVVINDLELDTTYFYNVGDGVTTSEVFSFKTPPASDSDEGSSLKFVFFGDMGLVNGENTRTYLNNLLAEDKFDLIFHAGDVGYADDAFLHAKCWFRFCYEDVFNEYMNEMQPIVSQIPWMTMPGNHEADCHSPACFLSKTKREALSNFTAYTNRFRMPSPESGGVLNQWHSFNYGPVHFVALDLETGFAGSAEEKRYIFKCGGFGDMVSWLEEDLKKADAERDIRPWIVIGGHHPMYQGGHVDKHMQAAIEPLLKQYNVDISFTGHVHSYERDYPVYNTTEIVTNYDNPGLPTHVMVGGPGNDEQSEKSTRELILERNADYLNQKLDGKLSPMDPSKVVTDKYNNKRVYESTDMIASVDLTHYGIGVINVDREKFSFQYVQTTTGEVFDEFTLTK